MVHLSTGHQIAATDANWQGVTLHGRWVGVPAALDVVQQCGRQSTIVERGNRRGDIATRCLNRNVLVDIKIDASVLSAIQGINLSLLQVSLLEGIIVSRPVKDIRRTSYSR